MGTFISDFLTAIGDGLGSFLPDIAQAGVDTVDIMFINDDGSFTVISILAAIGFVMWGGKKIFSLIKNKAKM